MGEMLGNKRQDRGKKNSGGQKLLGGDFLGKCQKRGGKTFWRFQKVVGIFLGVTTIFWGENFSGKILKKNIPWGYSLENCPNKFRGDFFRGVVYRGTCVGGMLGNKRQDRGKKKFRGPEIVGGTFWGNAKKGVEKLFGGSKKWWEFFWGSQQFFGGEFFRNNLKKKSPGGILWKIVQTNLGGIF